MLYPNTFGWGNSVKRVTVGGWWGYDSGICNSRWKTPPSYGVPSGPLMLACQMKRSCSRGLAVTPTVGMVSRLMASRSFNNLFVAKFYAYALMRVLKTAVSFAFLYIINNLIFSSLIRIYEEINYWYLSEFIHFLFKWLCFSSLVIYSNFFYLLDFY